LTKYDVLFKVHEQNGMSSAELLRRNCLKENAQITLLQLIDEMGSGTIKCLYLYNLYLNTHKECFVQAHACTVIS